MVLFIGRNIQFKFNSKLIFPEHYITLIIYRPPRLEKILKFTCPKCLNVIRYPLRRNQNFVKQIKNPILSSTWNCTVFPAFPIPIPPPPPPLYIPVSGHPECSQLSYFLYKSLCTRLNPLNVRY